MSTFEPVRSLLNPKFEGYKLAPLDQEHIVSRYPLQYKPSQSNVSGRSLVSFQEVQSRISHNHLTISPSGSAVYVDADLRVVSVQLDKASLEPSTSVLYELPKSIQSPGSDAPQREYPSAAFLSATSLFVSDGYGYLYALQVSEQGPAELLGTYELSIPPQYGSSKDIVPCRAHQAVQTSPESAIVILSSKHYPKNSLSSSEQSKTKHSAVEFDIWAVRFSLPLPAPEPQPRPLDIVWHRRGTDVPAYTAFDNTHQAFLLVSGSAYRSLDTPPAPEYTPSPDELAPIPRAEENLDNGENAPKKPPPYSWTQTSDSVTIAIPLPSSTRKDSIKVAFSPRTLTVLIRDDAMDVDGAGAPAVKPPRFDMKALWDAIQPATSLWTWDRQAEHTYGVLTLHLEKAHEGTRWSQVFAAAGSREASATASDEDAEVPETLDPSELWAIREALEKYTAAMQGEDISGLGLGTGVPSLAKEEMDDELDLGVGRTVCVTWVHADGSRPPYAHGDDAPTHLLSTPFPGAHAGRPSLVLKNGVDGLLYELSAGSEANDKPAWIHTSTYSALAFVLASKRDTRFTHHVSSKAVLAFESGSRDIGGNVYIYRGASTQEKWAKQAVVKVGGGGAGSLLGVGLIEAGSKSAMVCLCEGELIVLRDVL
ncbi:uncharacterized protein LAESUDRAFT_733918 [Laetiporus sulphureus 93-53]|uniref:NudC domain-containing protein 1 n=1 Tax=Laetiporus sulphureus 93-53 TaxID=1314785 RepID=A0A165HQE4_9APHY|nr:uncharacterized protein LAESUDRAFT_733918 [Laetiporus sulphureus 93-53]KZT12048.1 hypothetical protein LAESUDRAFT_733918 [Laetiporus sulphureus 93-53]